MTEMVKNLVVVILTQTERCRKKEWEEQYRLKDWDRTI